MVVGLADVCALPEGRNVVGGGLVAEAVNGGEVGTVRTRKVAALLGGMVLRRRGDNVGIGRGVEVEEVDAEQMDCERFLSAIIPLKDEAERHAGRHVNPVSPCSKSATELARAHSDDGTAPESFGLYDKSSTWSLLRVASCDGIDPVNSVESSSREVTLRRRPTLEGRVPDILLAPMFMWLRDGRRDNPRFFAKIVTSEPVKRFETSCRWVSDESPPRTVADSEPVSLFPPSFNDSRLDNRAHCVGIGPRK